MLLKPLFRQLFKPLHASLVGAFRRWAYSFDGVDDRATLQFRAINPDGDIDIQFRTGPVVDNRPGVAIVSQSSNNTVANCEFVLRASASGFIQLVIGGSYSSSMDAPLKPNSHYRVTGIGTGAAALTFYENGVQVKVGSLPRGTIREPSAATAIGVRGVASGGFADHYMGQLYDVRINGRLYPMRDRDQVIQLPYPSGLGGEAFPQDTLFVVPSGFDNSIVSSATGFSVTKGTTAARSAKAFNTPSGAPYLVEFDLDSVELGATVACFIRDGSTAGNGTIISSLTTAQIGKNRILFSRISGAANILFVSSVPANFTVSKVTVKPLWEASAIELVTNGDFSNGTTGWNAYGGGSLAVTSGQAVLTTAPAGWFERSVSLVAGQYYLVTGDLIALSGNTSARFGVVRGADGSYATIGTQTLTAAGKFSFIILAPATQAILNLRGDGSTAGTVTFDNISVRRLDNICNPLTLSNTASTGWSEVEGVPLPLLRWAYNFDGVDDRGQLAFRAINPDGDIDIEFKTGPTIPSLGNFACVVDQSISNNFSLKELYLQINTNGNLQLIVGGSYLTSNTNTVVEPNTSYRVQLVGNTLRYFRNSVQTQEVTVTRGTAREPAATTKIGAWSASASFGGFYFGSILDVRINGVLYSIADRNQAIQLPSPSGLGAELINLANIIWDGSSSNRLVFDNTFEFTAADTWGQRNYRIPITIQPNVPYFFDVEVLSGYNEGEMVRVTLNDKLGDGAPHITPVTLSFGTTTPFDTTSAHYGSYRDFGRVTNGSVRGVLIFPNATTFNWFIGTRLQGNQNGRVVRLRNLTLRPLWVASATELSTNRPAGNFMNTGESVVAGGGTSELMTADIPVEASTHYQVIALGGTSDRSRWQWRRASDNQWQWGASNLSYGSVDGPVSSTLLTPANCNAIRIYFKSSAATATGLSVRKIDSLCNPLTLTNTASTGWQEIEA